MILAVHKPPTEAAEFRRAIHVVQEESGHFVYISRCVEWTYVITIPGVPNSSTRHPVTVLVNYLGRSETAFGIQHILSQARESLSYSWLAAHPLEGLCLAAQNGSNFGV